MSRKSTKSPVVSANSLKVLEKRYFAKDENGKPIEDAEGLFRRVAESVASANIDAEERRKLADIYYDIMASMRFLPNSPTLMNAGRPLGQLSACFVLPVEDSMSEIFDTVKSTALIHQSGGGCIGGNSLVLTDRGPIKMRDLVTQKMDVKVLSYDPADGTCKMAVVGDWHINPLPADKIRVVTFSDGTVVKASDWHPFFVIRDEGPVETRADALVQGDIVLGSLFWDGTLPGVDKDTERYVTSGRDFVHLAGASRNTAMKAIAGHMFDVWSMPAWGQALFLRGVIQAAGYGHMDRILFPLTAGPEVCEKFANVILGILGYLGFHGVTDEAMRGIRIKDDFALRSLMMSHFPVKSRPESSKIVSSVEVAKEDETLYDLTVPGPQTYIAGENGFVVVHNTGFSFSRLREKGAIVKSTGGTASGPISFMNVINASTDAIKQGGTRRGANMGILRVDHPDILDFIDCKLDQTQVTNFNISVAITDKFMKAVEEGTPYDLVSPSTGKVVKSLDARMVFDRIAKNAWANGEPGLFFIDTANHYNPTPSRWSYEATNPCGEQVLGPYESCNLGSINLEKHVNTDSAGKACIDWNLLADSVQASVKFLNNVVDTNKFPAEKLSEINQGARRIGLGIMGFARLLMLLGIAYDSEEGLETAEKVMAFIREEAEKTSLDLAKLHGPYPYFEGIGSPKRNSHLLTIAPTGTISMIADTSSGCEPEFSIIWYKNVMDGTHLPYTLNMFETVARREGFWADDLPEKIVKNHGSCRGIDAVPVKWQAVFATAHDIAPEWHVRMQAAFQKSIDAAVSKTINMPESATVSDVEKAYKLAYSLGCKGITVYRDGSRKGQVLNTGTSDTKKSQEELPLEERNPEDLKWGTRLKVPGMLQGYRLPVKGKNGKFYVHIYTAPQDGRPLELFVTPAFDHAEKETILLFGRLGSLALQHGASWRSVLAQFLKTHESAEGPLGSDASLISKALDKLAKRAIAEAKGNHNEEDVKISRCPQCKKGRMAFQEGCLKCTDPTCGYSKCS